MDRKGKLNSNMINVAVVMIVVIAVLFQVYTTLIPSAQTAGASMNDTARCEAAGYYWNTSETDCYLNSTEGTALDYNQIPLSGLFNAGSVVFLVIMASLLIVIVTGALRKNKR